MEVQFLSSFKQVVLDLAKSLGRVFSVGSYQSLHLQVPSDLTESKRRNVECLMTGSPVQLRSYKPQIIWGHPELSEVWLAQNQLDNTGLKGLSESDYSFIYPKNFEHRLNITPELIEDSFMTLEDISETVSMNYEFDRETMQYKLIQEKVPVDEGKKPHFIHALSLQKQ